jgi:4'-phosphopantetheinyl transferase
VGARDIHLWPVWLRGDATALAAGRALLSPDEAAAADRRIAAVHSEFIFSRASLRVLTGRYTSTPPTEICFSLGPNGKPGLSPTHLHFNVSHSRGLALYAFAANCELGIDVEYIRPFDDMDSIAKRYFCTEEAAQLGSLPASEQTDAFFRCWTRKEAYIKADGEGLSLPLDSFQVTLRPGDPARFVHIGKDPVAADLWTLHDLSPMHGLVSGFAAALAYRDSVRPIILHDIRTAGDLLT